MILVHQITPTGGGRHPWSYLLCRRYGRRAGGVDVIRTVFLAAPRHTALYIVLSLHLHASGSGSSKHAHIYGDGYASHTERLCLPASRR